MKLQLLFPCLFIFFLSGFGQSIGIIEKADCFLNDCSFIPQGREVEFGKITVPEDYSKPDKRLLKMSFAIIKSNDLVKNPDPVIFFQGGWGGSSIGYLRSVLQTLNFPGRDIIIFDRRGTGYSEPEMCNWLGTAAWEDLTSNISHDDFQKRQTERLNACLDSLELKKIDFNQYGHNTQAKDVILLAEKLNYPAYNLFGVSNGTRAVQNFLRAADSSSIKIRAAVFDSGVPMGRSVHGQLSTTYARVLDLLLEDCKNNQDCNRNFPHLKSRYFEFLSSLTDNPFIVRMQDGNKFTFNREEVNHMISIFSSSSFSHANVPMLMEQFIGRDSSAIAGYMPVLKMGTLNTYNGVGAINSVYDHKAFQNQAAIDYKSSLRSYADYMVVDGYVDFYLNDSRFVLNPMEGKPVKSLVPSLILAGDYDPVTPPQWTENLLPHLQNNYYYKLPKLAHMVGMDPCIMSLIREFIENFEVRPDPDCLKDLIKREISFSTLD